MSELSAFQRVPFPRDWPEYVRSMSGWPSFRALPWPIRRSLEGGGFEPTTFGI